MPSERQLAACDPWATLARGGHCRQPGCAQASMVAGFLGTCHCARTRRLVLESSLSPCGLGREPLRAGSGPAAPPSHEAQGGAATPPLVRAAGVPVVAGLSPTPRTLQPGPCRVAATWLTWTALPPRATCPPSRTCCGSECPPPASSSTLSTWRTSSSGTCTPVLRGWRPGCLGLCDLQGRSTLLLWGQRDSPGPALCSQGASGPDVR